MFIYKLVVTQDYAPSVSFEMSHITHEDCSCHFKKKWVSCRSSVIFPIVYGWLRHTFQMKPDNSNSEYFSAPQGHRKCPWLQLDHCTKYRRISKILFIYLRSTACNYLLRTGVEFIIHKCRSLKIKSNLRQTSEFPRLCSVVGWNYCLLECLVCVNYKGSKTTMNLNHDRLS